MINIMLTMSKAPTTTGININNKKLINLDGKRLMTTWTGLNVANVLLNQANKMLWKK